MILHCKNPEMTILLSFLHFYSVKSYNFCYSFSPIQICFRLNKKKILVIFIFYFFPSSDLNILKKKSVNQVLKKIRPKGSNEDNALDIMKSGSSFGFVFYVDPSTHFRSFKMQLVILGRWTRENRSRNEPRCEKTGLRGF